MDLENCKISKSTCPLCCTEKLKQAWEDGPPDWLFKYEDGDFGIYADYESYQSWRRENIVEQPCFVVEYVSDYDGYNGSTEILVICKKHLSEIVLKLDNMSP